ncbi:MAG: hypothetical protein RL693_117, partial [Verrucomicrobiota bacterium]
MRYTVSLTCILWAVIFPWLAADENADELHFVSKVLPVFKAKCLACHGDDPKKIKGDFDMRTQKSFQKGGESEHPPVIAGNPESSPLFVAVSRTDADLAMPPKENDKLASPQMEDIKHWILKGAPWPEDERILELQKWAAKNSSGEGIIVTTSGGLSADWTNRLYKQENLWAYQPVKKEIPPTQTDNAIDNFIAAKMPEGLKPAPAADRVTLIRRATFDLTGLPPTPEEVASFVGDTLPDKEAFQKVIERLLASPHYGERMAQHWLDVTRYADTSGFANDYERGNAWRYRDYVVRSFNSDKPYDKFVREQIAGDEIDPENPEMLIATGFLRMGPWELTGMEVAKVARQRFLDDVSNSVGETFLAHSLQCARCHDHKFDPIPTQDYYGLQAVFATTQLTERKASFLPVENTSGFEEKKYLENHYAEHLITLRALDDKLLANAEKWFAQKKLDHTAWDKAVNSARDSMKSGKNPGGRTRNFAGIFEAARTSLQKQGLPEDQYPPKLHGFSAEDYGNERVARKGLERLKWELDRYEPIAFAVYDGRTPNVTAVLEPVRMPANRMSEGELEETCVHTGGDPFASGKKVKPGVLSVLAAVQKTPVPDTIEGRRKAFAEWVASAENSLTTRAIVNRIWLWHFDQPIAGNPNNFGSTGKKPTHPELLDWLAATFVEKGWSFKDMHRLIMNSEAYRRSTSHPDLKAIAAHDPTGTSYAVFKPRRLTAEE